MNSTLVEREKSGISLCEAIDRVLTTGVVAQGDLMISVANVDLVYLALRLFLSSVETARESGAIIPLGVGSGSAAAFSVAPEPLQAFSEEPRPLPPVRHQAVPPSQPDKPVAEPSIAAEVVSGPPRIDVGERDENLRKGLAQLVVALVKLLHELMERQAMHRIDGGSLTDQQIEKLGTTLMKQAEEIRWVQKQLGLSDEDLNLDLGPLGKLY